jgi:hypothetical protein
MRRSFGLAVLVLLAWVSLGACYLGPDPVQYAALAVIDGRPTAVVAACGRSTVSVEVYMDDNDPMAQEMRLWSVTATLLGPVRDVNVELLGAARPGWEITTEKYTTVGSSPGTFRVVPLTSIEAGHRYVLNSSKGGPEGASAPSVKFTTKDLPTIGPGRVMVPVDHEHSKIVSQESFTKDRCG